jgi:hypothetical protein
MPKIAITGGRDVSLSDSDKEIIRELYISIKADGFVLGDCPTGVDFQAQEYLKTTDFPFVVKEADWDTHGKVAGPIRNQAMIDEVAPDGCLLAFPGGSGTANCILKAKKANLVVIFSGKIPTKEAYLLMPDIKSK